MSDRARPLFARGRQRRGPCGLCGKVTLLTRTHVPPRCAFNDGPTRTVMKAEAPDGPQSARLGSQRLGGARAYLACGRCNGATSLADNEYCRWVQAIRPIVARARGEVSAGRARFVADLPATIGNGSPGSFIRSALAGLLALHGRIAREFPYLASAVLAGTPQQLPDEFRFLVALHVGIKAFVGGGPATRIGILPPATHAAGLWIPSTEEELPYAAIHFPPFSLVLASPAQARQLPHADYSPWLEEPPDRRRDVNLLLPVVDDLIAPQLGGVVAIM